MKEPPRPFSALRGFTLIELLAVIMIIGILSAIIIPVVGRVRSAARSAACASNLHQLGRAIQLYANEHRGRLPGPTWAGIQVEFSADSNVQNTAYGIRYNLLTHLAPYLVNFTNTGAKRYEALACPAWLQVATDLTKPCYLANDRIVRADGTSFRPWGDTDNNTPATMLVEVETPAATWAIQDVDKKLITNSYLTWYSSLPATPVHDTHRNQLYFDWHVSKAKAN